MGTVQISRHRKQEKRHQSVQNYIVFGVEGKSKKFLSSDGRKRRKMEKLKMRTPKITTAEYMR